jgi:hypothetical protein
MINAPLPLKIIAAFLIVFLSDRILIFAWLLVPARPVILSFAVPLRRSQSKNSRAPLTTSTSIFVCDHNFFLISPLLFQYHPVVASLISPELDYFPPEKVSVFPNMDDLVPLFPIVSFFFTRPPN